MRTNGQPLPPLTYPAWEVKGEIFHLKLGLSAYYLLETAGVSLSEVSNQLRNHNIPFHLLFQLAAAMLGSPTPDGRWKSLGISPLELADSMAAQRIDEEMTAMKALSDAVLEALVKAQPARMTTPEAAPADVGGATPIS